jgi:hypothetical protein
MRWIAVSKKEFIYDAGLSVFFKDPSGNVQAREFGDPENCGVDWIKRVGVL